MFVHNEFLWKESKISKLRLIKKQKFKIWGVETWSYFFPWKQKKKFVKLQLCVEACMQWGLVKSFLDEDSLEQSLLLPETSQKKQQSSVNFTNHKDQISKLINY